MLSERDDIIVITDEAHRSQYDTLALNMRQALPNAAFLAFTGTPLIAGEESTRRVFGDYVSVYDFLQSVEDRATVPLFYENRIPELQLSNPDLNEDMERLLEEAALDEAQEKKLEREFAREYHLITRDDRLEAVAEDLVRHFSERGFRGKAMAISIDKATAVRMSTRCGRIGRGASRRCRGAVEAAGRRGRGQSRARRSHRLDGGNGYGGRRVLVAERDSGHEGQGSRLSPAPAKVAEGGPGEEVQGADDLVRRCSSVPCG